MKKGVLVFIGMVSCSILFAKPVLDDSLFYKKRIQLLQSIEQLQEKKESGFLNGSFPSYRRYFYGSAYIQEDNVFFTALVLFNIGQFSKKMRPEELAYLEQFKTNARPYIERFKNQNNQLTYNFWPRNPPQIFPNGGWLNRFNQKFALADDIDDGAITLLALGEND